MKNQISLGNKHLMQFKIYHYFLINISPPMIDVLLISENRPEWLISDLSIMLSKGITVPAYTTYVERDYEFLINDCKPSVIIASDAIQLKKINTIIKKYSFIKKVISF
jgi:long-chain acyl-CoA synthetase